MATALSRLGLLFALIPLLGAHPNDTRGPGSILGIWQRQGDGLLIEIRGDVFSPEGAHSEVVDWHDWQFPCDIPTQKPFYRRIRWNEDKQAWDCNFLVYYVDACESEYLQRGVASINQDDNLVIVCPGHPTRVFYKNGPRFQSSN